MSLASLRYLTECFQSSKQPTIGQCMYTCLNMYVYVCVCVCVHVHVRACEGLLPRPSSQGADVLPDDVPHDYPGGLPQLEG